MTFKRKSKTNGTTFMDIPKPSEDAQGTKEILSKLKRKYDLKEQRTKKVQEKRDINAEIYNLSKAINKLEFECDSILMSKVFKDVESI